MEVNGVDDVHMAVETIHSIWIVLYDSTGKDSCVIFNINILVDFLNYHGKSTMTSYSLISIENWL